MTVEDMEFMEDEDKKKAEGMTTNHTPTSKWIASLADANKAEFFAAVINEHTRLISERDELVAVLERVEKAALRPGSDLHTAVKNALAKVKKHDPD